MAKRQKSVCFIQLMLKQPWLKAKLQLWNASQQWGCFVFQHTGALTEKHLYTFTGACVGQGLPLNHTATTLPGGWEERVSVGYQWVQAGRSCCWQPALTTCLSGSCLASHSKAGRDARQSHGWPGNIASTNGRVCKIIAQERKLALKIPTENGFLLHIRKTKNFQ